MTINIAADWDAPSIELHGLIQDYRTGIPRYIGAALSQGEFRAYLTLRERRMGRGTYGGVERRAA